MVRKTFCGANVLRTENLPLVGRQAISACAVLSASALSFATPPVAPPQKTINSLTVVTQSGQKIDLATIKSWKVVYFWSSSCPCVKRCQEQSLVPLAARYKNHVRFFAIASNASNMRYGSESSQEANIDNPLSKPVTKAVFPASATPADGLSTPSLSAIPPSSTPALELSGDELPRLPYPLVVDNRHHVADALGAGHTPETFLISPDNRIVFRGDPDNSGAMKTQGDPLPGSRHYLADALAQVFAGKKVKTPFAPTYGCEIDRSDVMNLPNRADK